MQIAAIRVDDVVEVDIHGRRFYALVRNIDRVSGLVTILPSAVNASKETYRTATSRQIIAHLRRTPHSAPSVILKRDRDLEAATADA